MYWLPDHPDGQPSHESEDIEQLYESLSAVLLRTLQKQYGLDPVTAERVIEQHFLGYVQIAPHRRPEDPEAYLTAAVCLYAAKFHGKQPNEGAGEVSRTRDPLLTRKRLALLSEREKKVMKMRLSDRMSVEEIAAAMNRSPAYIRWLVNQATQKLLDAGEAVEP